MALVWDDENWLRGFRMLLHNWSCEIAHRAYYSWKLFFPIDYVLGDNWTNSKLFDIHKDKEGLATYDTDGSIVYDNRLEVMDVVRAERDGTGNCGPNYQGSGNLYKFEHQVGWWDGTSSQSKRDSYDSHPFYIDTGTQVSDFCIAIYSSDHSNWNAHGHHQIFQMGLCTPEGMYNQALSGVARQYYWWGCAFHDVSQGGTGLQEISFNTANDTFSNAGEGYTVTASNAGVLNTWYIGAPYIPFFHLYEDNHANAPGGNSGYYPSRNNELWLPGGKNKTPEDCREDTIPRYKHAVYPNLGLDKASLEDAISFNFLLIDGNYWRIWWEASGTDAHDNSYTDTSSDGSMYRGDSRKGSALRFQSLNGNYYTSKASENMNYSINGSGNYNQYRTGTSRVLGCTNTPGDCDGGYYSTGYSPEGHYCLGRDDYCQWGVCDPEGYSQIGRIASHMGGELNNNSNTTIAWGTNHEGYITYPTSGSGWNAGEEGFEYNLWIRPSGTVAEGGKHMIACNFKGVFPGDTGKGSGGTGGGGSRMPTSNSDRQIICRHAEFENNEWVWKSQGYMFGDASDF